MTDLVIPAVHPVPRARVTAFRSLASCAQLAITLLMMTIALLPSAFVVQSLLARFGLLGGLLALPVAYALWGISFCLIFAAVKRCVLWRPRPGTYPYLSAVVLRWAFVTQLSKVAHQMFLFWVMGTDILVWWYRLLGARIGERVTINTVFVYDWDMLEIGDDSFVGGRTTLMAHVGQMGHVTFTPTRIGARCTIGQDTTVFPGVVMGDGATLGANSLALEGQHLEAGKVYLGVPARYVRKRPGTPPSASDAAPSASGLLDRNESPYPPSPRCLAILRDPSVDKLSRYARQDVLRPRLAAWLGIEAERIVLGAGAEALLKTAFDHFLGKGKGVLLPSPSWWYYDHLASRTGAIADHYALTESTAGFSTDVDDILRRARSLGPSLVVLASPNNPTGHCLPPEHLVGLLERLDGATPVLLDEAYWGFAGSDNSDLRRVAARFPNVLVVRTFSKFFGLPGIRLGFAVVGPGLAGLREAASVYLGHNRMAEDLAAAAIDDVAYYDARAADIRLEKERFATRLRGSRHSTVYPSDANFLLVRLAPAAVHAFRERIGGAGISVKFFAEPGLECCVRISLGTPAQNGIVLECLEAVELGGAVR
jgi:histidinol-phosphate aminotransferase